VFQHLTLKIPRGAVGRLISVCIWYVHILFCFSFYTNT
jgi:hypothetical protein